MSSLLPNYYRARRSTKGPTEVVCVRKGSSKKSKRHSRSSGSKGSGSVVVDKDDDDRYDEDRGYRHEPKLKSVPADDTFSEADTALDPNYTPLATDYHKAEMPSRTEEPRDRAPTGGRVRHSQGEDLDINIGNLRLDNLPPIDPIVLLDACLYLQRLGIHVRVLAGGKSTGQCPGRMAPSDNRAPSLGYQAGEAIQSAYDAFQIVREAGCEVDFPIPPPAPPQPQPQPQPSPQLHPTYHRCRDCIESFGTMQELNAHQGKPKVRCTFCRQYFCSGTFPSHENACDARSGTGYREPYREPQYPRRG